MEKYTRKSVLERCILTTRETYVMDHGKELKDFLVGKGCTKEEADEIFASLIIKEKGYPDDGFYKLVDGLKARGVILREDG